MGAASTVGPHSPTVVLSHIPCKELCLSAFTSHDAPLESGPPAPRSPGRKRKTGVQGRGSSDGADACRQGGYSTGFIHGNHGAVGGSPGYLPIGSGPRQDRGFQLRLLLCFSVMVLADSATCSTCSVIWLQPASSCRSKSRTKRATTGSSKKFAGCFWHAAVSGWIWNSLVLNQSSLSLSYWVQYKRPSLQFHSRDCPVLVATGSTVISSPSTRPCRCIQAFLAAPVCPSPPG